jgi:hypothetical protein
MVAAGHVKGVIITVDRWWFRGDGSPVEIGDEGEAHGLTNSFRMHAELFRELVRGEFAVGECLNPINRGLGVPALGLGAVGFGGYRPDGSFCYGRVIAERRMDGAVYRDWNWRPIIDNARGRLERFGPPYAPEPQHRGQFRKALETLTNAGIRVALVNPPYASDLWKLLNDDLQHRILTEAETEIIETVASELGLAYVDARDVASLGLDDMSMFDGNHSSETANAMILRELWKRPDCPEILRGCGLDVLEDVLASSKPWELDQEKVSRIRKAWMNPATGPAPAKAP